MSGRARLFSEFDAQDSSSSIGVFTSSCVDSVQESKRRKTAGLNSRFDRMVETINATRRPPIKAGRRRGLSSGSSSVSSHDVPKTPVDAYSQLQEGRLGETFSLIKMESSSILSKRSSWRPGLAKDIVVDDQDPDQSKTHTPTRHTLPDWLSNAFSTLGAKHPLRLLLPTSHQQTVDERTSDDANHPIDEPSHLAQLQPNAEEEPVFAFCPSPGRAEIRDETVHRCHETAGKTALESPINFISQQPFSTLQTPDFSLEPPVKNTGSKISLEYVEFGNPSQPSNAVIPFSTPGPGSHVSSSVLPASNSRPLPLPDFNFPPAYLVTTSPSYLRLLQSKSPHLPLITSSLGHVTSEPAFSDPSDEYSFYDDLATDDSASDPPLQSTHTYNRVHPDPFSTPGPGYHAPRPIYFDSPTEDPSDSDPLQPGYELDYDALDFRWEPFIRNAETRILDQTKVLVPSSPYQDQTFLSSHEPREISIEARNDESLGPMPNKYDTCTVTQKTTPFSEKLLSPSPFQFSPLEDKMHELLGPFQPAHEVFSPFTPEYEAVAPVFAPGPGILISPLHNFQSSELGLEDIVDTSHKDLNTQGPEHKTKKDPTTKRRISGKRVDLGSQTEESGNVQSCSQVSNDSIESWKGADA